MLLDDAAGHAAPAESAANAVDLDAAFRTHAPFLLRAVERLTGSGAHVEDIVQEVFIVAHHKGDALPAEPALRGYLYGVARHKAQHHRRFFARFARFAAAFGAVSEAQHATAPDDTASRRQQALHIRRATLALPFALREVFVLHELEGLTAKAIAELLGIAEGTVWSRLSSARAAFKSHYGAVDAAPSPPKSTPRGAP